VQGQPIRGCATLDDGDRIRIGSQQFAVEIRSG
jgi:predicted component of type VI protein secretion system